MTEDAQDAGGVPPIPGWAHDIGLIALGNGLNRASPEDNEHRRLVIERVARYCWSYDERRADLLADCFTEDAVWEGDVLGRVDVGPFEGRNRIIDWLTGFWPHQRDQRRHMILNNLVEHQGATTARTLSYLLLMGSDGKASSIECTGLYSCNLSREGDVWRISRMTAGFDAPFWPGEITTMSERGRARHGIRNAG